MDRAKSNHIKMTKTPVGKLILMLGIPTTISMPISHIAAGLISVPFLLYFIFKTPNDSETDVLE